MPATYRILVPTLVLCLASGCVYEWGVPPVSDTAEPSLSLAPPELPVEVLQKSEKVEWGPNDQPSLFAPDLEYTFEALPLEGESEQIPWTGSYWPVWEDSINHRWAGTDSMSPAAKYGEAFGIQDVEDMVSAHHGIDRYVFRTTCETNDECDSSIGEACAIREGEEGGYCIPTWWGICHAWAPVSILEPEPQQPVERNGVVFEVNDIKALATLGYNRTFSRFVSLRCNEDEEAGEITYDGYDRPTGDDIECADTNAGTFHVILTNYLGIKGESFIEDRTFDDEVWNQPIRGYTVVSQQQLDAATANSYVGAEAHEAELLVSFSGALENQAWTHRPPIQVEGGAPIEVTMTGSGDADLYVRLGAQPTGAVFDCRPYSATSNEVCEIEVPEEGGELYVSVRGYSGQPEFEVHVESLGQSIDEYLFNDAAEDFVHVVVRVEYIAESPSWLDGNLADSINSYTGTDLYQYVLELDGEGKIIGGEWVGASKRNHPDFLWLPETRDPYQSIAGGTINFEQIRELIDASVGVGPESGAGTTDQREVGILVKGEWAMFGPLALENGTITAVMTGTGDADLYLRRGEEPTVTEFDCRPYAASSNETCEMTGAGPYYVGVRAYSNSTFDLTISRTTLPESPPVEEEEPALDDTETVHLDAPGTVAHGEMFVFAVDLSENQQIVVETTAPNDVDLYLRFDAAPTTSVYDMRAFTVSGNERLEFTASSAGRLHVGVHGWAASAFTLVTSDD